MFDKGIWKLLDKYKMPECDLINNNMMYKQFKTINQVLNLLKNKRLFCIQYNLYEGCTICTTPKLNDKFLSPCVKITKNNLISKTN